MAALAFGAVAGEAQADEGMDISAGVLSGLTIDLDADDELDESSTAVPLGLDGRIGFGLSDDLDLVVNPAIHAYLFEDNANQFRFNLNALVQMDMDVVSPYLGAGAGLTVISPDADELDSDNYLNFQGILGTSINLDAPVSPFVQAEFTHMMYDDEYEEFTGESSTQDLSFLVGVHYGF